MIVPNLGFIILVILCGLFLYNKYPVEGMESSPNNLKQFVSKTLDIVDKNFLSPQDAVQEDAAQEDAAQEDADADKDVLSEDKEWKEKLNKYLTAQNNSCGIDPKIFNSNDGPPYPVNALNGFKLN